MKDEIKEILEGIEVVIKHDGTLEFDAKELKILLDYITNLQEENEKLTAESTQWEERTYCWQDTSSNLQIKIDKAVEVLKLCNSKCSKEVINILNGDDE